MNFCRDADSSSARSAEVVKIFLPKKSGEFFLISHFGPREEKGGVAHGEDGHDRDAETGCTNVKSDASPIVCQNVKSTVLTRKF